MKLYEVLKEEELKISGISDSSSADMFLAKMDKKKIDVSYPAVSKKLQGIKAVIKNINASDGRYESLKGAADKLSSWLKEHPLTRVSNPARIGIYRNYN